MTLAGDPLRLVRLETGHVLETADTMRPRDGKTRIAYELRTPSGAVLFSGADFFASPLHADDSDATLRGLCGFLFLRPGDTDREYFASYTPAQMAFASSTECEWLAFLYRDDGEGTFVDIEEGDA